MAEETGIQVQVTEEARFYLDGLEQRLGFITKEERKREPDQFLVGQFKEQFYGLLKIALTQPELVYGDLANKELAAIVEQALLKEPDAAQKIERTEDPVFTKYLTESFSTEGRLHNEPAEHLPRLLVRMNPSLQQQCELPDLDSLYGAKPAVQAPTAEIVPAMADLSAADLAPELDHLDFAPGHVAAVPAPLHTDKPRADRMTIPSYDILQSSAPYNPSTTAETNTAVDQFLSIYREFGLISSNGTDPSNYPYTRTGAEQQLRTALGALTNGTSTAVRLSLYLQEETETGVEPIVEGLVHRSEPISMDAMQDRAAYVTFAMDLFRHCREAEGKTNGRGSIFGVREMDKYGLPALRDFIGQQGNGQFRIEVWQVPTSEPEKYEVRLLAAEVSVPQ